MYLVDEKVLRPRNAEQGLDEGLELLWGLHGSVSVSVEVEIRDMVVIDAFGPELFGDALHEAGLPAAADPGDHLDHPVVMVEAADLFQVVSLGNKRILTPIFIGVSISNLVFIGVYLAEDAIYTPIT